MVDKFKSALMKKVHATATSMMDDEKGAQNPSSTKSMTHLMMRRREELEDKRRQNEVKAQEDKDRFEKQNRVILSQILHLLTLLCLHCIVEGNCPNSFEGSCEERQREERGGPQNEKGKYASPGGKCQKEDPGMRRSRKTETIAH